MDTECCGHYDCPCWSDSGTPDSGTGRDSGPCAFGPPVNLSSVNSDFYEGGPSLSADGLTIYFHSHRLGGQGQGDVWRATRGDALAEFGPPVNVVELNTADREASPAISADGLTVYFVRYDLGDPPYADIWVADRPDVGSAFGVPVNVVEVNSAFFEYGPSISGDGETLYLDSDRPGGPGLIDIWCATRPGLSSPFGEPQVVLGVSTAGDEGAPSISADGLTLFFTKYSDDPGSPSGLYFATREDVLGAFDVVGPVGALNSLAGAEDLEVSVDGLWAYFGSRGKNGLGGGDLWVSSRPCAQ